jgi:hypothetical protein
MREIPASKAKRIANNFRRAFSKGFAINRARSECSAYRLGIIHIDRAALPSKLPQVLTLTR